MYWHPLPYSPYGNPYPERTGHTFQSQPLPPYTGPPAVNAPLPREWPQPPVMQEMHSGRRLRNNDQQWPDNPPLHRLGEPIPPTHALYDPQPAGMLEPNSGAPWGQVIQPAHEQYNQQTGCIGGENCNCPPEDVLPGAVPHNNDPWPWDRDNGNCPVSPSVARRQFAMRRPPRPRLRRRPSRAPAFDEFTLAPRPSDWRPDFRAKPYGLLRRLSRVRGKFRKKKRQSWYPSSHISPIILEIKRSTGGNYSLNALLLYNNGEDYPITYDLRQEPEVIDITFLNLNRPSNNLDFCQLATTPPVNELCIWHPRLPWYIRIQAAQDNGITVKDVLSQIYDQLAESIWSNHYWNVELSAQDREQMRYAFQYRCGNDQQRQRKGLSKIDFLKFDCVFLGLAKSKDGMWEMKTREVTP
jgi:hypothetical protein